MPEPNPNFELLFGSLEKRYKQGNHILFRTGVTFLLTWNSSSLALAGRMALTATYGNPIMNIVFWNNPIPRGPTLLEGFCLYRSWQLQTSLKPP